MNQVVELKEPMNGGHLGGSSERSALLLRSSKPAAGRWCRLAVGESYFGSGEECVSVEE